MPPSGEELPDRELLIEVRKELRDLREQLLWIAPTVRTFPVVHPDPTRNLLFLELEAVCFVTTKSDDDRYEVMFVTEGGETFYSAKPLSQIAAEVSAGNARCMQSGKYYVINLKKVTAFTVTEARGLWFKGLPDRVENAVTDKWLSEFQRRLPH